MKGIVFATRATREIFGNIFEGSAIEATWVEAPGATAFDSARTAAFASAAPPDFVLDLDYAPPRTPALAQYPAALILVNDVPGLLRTSDDRFVRINAWNTFLQRPLAELVAHPAAAEKAGAFCAAWGKTPELLPDQPGMPSARVVSMIINEAYLALGEEVSTKEAIDTAMRLGTNYPYGPFEWARHIGLSSIVSLLETLARENPIYTVAPRLKEESTHGLTA
ncbi:3-hydroxyacyl-CoA dehydrogenase family protein [Dinghuibacter silviterrae]|uniref:3-hydroxybutyryl-CoA dehydrogenase n=1 Tax=Dinghuibacter silviterrae TaxID=1539049 RepID=A0A4V3GLH2_9BACT|nr:3-hydroxyacyl-CoA dehydrogenase family protein [Dinghuibacter silviterrae]TDW99512.1 3-hydroxybutyryl-CoA dehydrogenase [Dinghuibacter silviterrae]